VITLYSKATSNGRKASIMLEECGLPYEVHAMELADKVQKEPWFLAINPNGRIPAIVDDDGPGEEKVSVFESGAILFYLAEKSGKLLPAEGPQRTVVMNWLFFASTHITHTGLQVHWQVRCRNEGQEHAHLEIWKEENERVYGVVENGLADGRAYLAGDEYSVADIAAYPWAYRWEFQELPLDRLPNTRAWIERVGARDAVKRGLNIPPRDDGM
jgi:GST-like protein